MACYDTMNLVTAFIPPIATVIIVGMICLTTLVVVRMTSGRNP